MLTTDDIREFLDAARSPVDGDVIRAALVLPRIERGQYDTAPTLKQITRLGAIATVRIERLGDHPSPQAQVDALNALLFEDEGFHGNIPQYEDPRNSFLPDVLERRTGLPIALAVVYVEVGRRAGVPLQGVNFPGHFLVRHRSGRRSAERDLIIDPFHGGAILGPSDLRALLRKVAGDDAAFDRRLLVEASDRDTLVRMTTNLKRTYVSLRAYAHARAATDLLLAMDPLSVGELRDRGLLAYHLRDFAPALRDLEGYLAAASRSSGPVDEEQREEYQQVWEHVKALRRRVAGFN